MGLDDAENDFPELTSLTSVLIDENNFPDEIFRNYVKTNFDTDNDSSLSDDEINAAVSINVQGMDIKTLKGIEFLTALTYLNCTKNNLVYIDLSKNTALTTFIMDPPPESGPPGASQTFSIETDDPFSPNIDDIVKAEIKKYGLDIDDSEISAAIVYWFTGNYDKDNHKFSYKDTAAGRELKYAAAIRQGNNYIITTINITKPYVAELPISAENFPDENFRNYISSQIDKDGNGTLSADERNNTTVLYLDNLGIKTLKGIENFPMLTTLHCADNKIKSFDFSSNTNISELHIGGNPIVCLDLTPIRSAASSLDKWSYNVTLEIGNVETPKQLSEIVTNAIKERDSNIDFSRVINFPVDSKWSVDNSGIHFNEMTNQIKYKYTTTVGRDPIDVTITFTEKVVEINEENFPSSELRQYLKENCNSEGNIDIEKLRDSYGKIKLTLDNKNINDLRGIENISGLEVLECNNCGITGELDLSGCKDLTEVRCERNNITKINFDGLQKIETVSILFNALESIDVTNSNVDYSKFSDFDDSNINKKIKIIGDPDKFFVPKLNESGAYKLTLSYFDVTDENGDLSLDLSEKNINELNLIGLGLRKLSTDKLPNNLGKNTKDMLSITNNQIIALDMSKFSLLNADQYKTFLNGGATCFGKVTEIKYNEIVDGLLSDDGIDVLPYLTAYDSSFDLSRIKNEILSAGIFSKNGGGIVPEIKLDIQNTGNKLIIKADDADELNDLFYKNEGSGISLMSTSSDLKSSLISGDYYIMISSVYEIGIDRIDENSGYRFDTHPLIDLIASPPSSTVTDPPTTDPPVTDPPTTDPPATDPPATDPPTTDPPVTDPPTTETIPTTTSPYITETEYPPQQNITSQAQNYMPDPPKVNYENVSAGAKSKADEQEIINNASFAAFAVCAATAVILMILIRKIRKR